MRTWKTLLVASALVLTSALIPPAHAAPSITASSAGTKTVGHDTYAWGTVSERGARQVWTEVLRETGWSRSQRGTTRADGGYTLPLTFASTTVGTVTYRVGASTSSGTVYSPNFRLKRTAWTVGNVGTKRVGEHTNAWGTMPTAAGRHVWTEVWLGNRWSRSQTRTAARDGSFAIPLTYGADRAGTTMFRVVANTTQGLVRSQPFHLERVQQRYSVTATTAGTKLVGEQTNVWGTVRGHGGGTVWTEAWLGDRWSRSQTRNASASGGYAIPLTYGANAIGTTTYRVGASTPAGTVYSPSVTLTRTGRPAPATAQQMLDAVNRFRTAGATCGTQRMPAVAPLALHERLVQAAQSHSDDQARMGRMRHEGSDGSMPWDRMTRVGYPWRKAGENVARDTATVDAVTRAWMASPEHCHNIMSADFTEFGGAVTRGSDGTPYWTQVFGRR